MWNTDLETCSYFRNTSEKLLAVGWLEGDHPYTTGVVDRAVCDRFAEMLWTQEYHYPCSYMGGHRCTLCDTADSAPPGTMVYNGVRTCVGCMNLWIPGPTATFVAPSLMLHYMVDHSYLPPQEFCDALLACPPIGSEAYYQALEPVAPPWLEKWVRRRGVDPRDMPWRVDGSDIASHRVKQGKVSGPQIEFTTPAGERLAGSDQLQALAAEVHTIIQEVCERIVDNCWMTAIISVHAERGAPAAVSVAFFSDVDPELGGRVSARLHGLQLRLDVDAPTHVRLHYSIYEKPIIVPRSAP